MLLMRLDSTHILKSTRKLKLLQVYLMYHNGREMVKYAKGMEAACVLGHINGLKSDDVLNVQ